MFISTGNKIRQLAQNIQVCPAFCCSISQYDMEMGPWGFMVMLDGFGVYLHTRNLQNKSPWEIIWGLFVVDMIKGHIMLFTVGDDCSQSLK